MARLSISRIITALAEQDPARVVAIDDDTRLTARDLDLRSNRLARAYAALGVGRDDLVTVSLPNSVELVVAVCAIWKLGATPQPVSTGLDAREREALVELARPALVVGFEVAGPCVPPGFAPDPALSDGRLEDAWAASWKAPTSSGSTGPPKIVLATAPALQDPSRPVAEFLPLGGVHLVCGPLVHSATFTYSFRALMTGATLVILPRFDERRVLRAIAEHGVTWALLVPTMMSRLLRLPEAERAGADLSSLGTVLHLGAPCAPSVKRAFADWVGAATLVEVYAGSESNGLVMMRGDEWEAHPGSVGRPIGGTTLSIRSPSGEPVATGESGTIWMRREGGPTYRYVGAAGRRTDDGWDTLGDLGHLDADGYLYVEDRADDSINRGGVTVHPVEVERVMEEHPVVRSAVAVGIADDDLGQRIEVVADVAESDVEAAELLAWVRKRIDRERRPAAVHLTREPVRSDAGKTNRRTFRALVEAGRFRASG